MKTISIMGCGWLGLHLGSYLVDRGYKVKGSTTSTEKLAGIRSAGIEAYQISAADQLSGANIPAFFQSDILILNIPPRRRIPDIEERYPRQIRAVLEAIRAGSIKKLLFVSSTGVYGNVNRRVTESETPVPETASGKALMTCEAFLQKEPDLNLTILRLSGLVGGERKAGRFLAGRQKVAGAKAPVNLIHREDCIQIIHQILLQEKWGEIYNATADEHPEKQAFYQVQTQKMGLEPPSFLAETEPSYKLISNEKLKRELAYQFLHPDPMKF